VRAQSNGFASGFQTLAAEAVGLGRAAQRRATDYAKQRVVFGRPIGQNQAIQHPLAESSMELETANLMVLQAAWQYDNGLARGPAANAAKYLAAEAGFKACQTAVLVHRGYGYAREYRVESN
jgi:acyl-CoA dehydrogenase